MIRECKFMTIKSGGDEGMVATVLVGPELSLCIGRRNKVHGSNYLLPHR